MYFVQSILPQRNPTEVEMKVLAVENVAGSYCVGLYTILNRQPATPDTSMTRLRTYESFSFAAWTFLAHICLYMQGNCILWNQGHW